MLGSGWGTVGAVAVTSGPACEMGACKNNLGGFWLFFFFSESECEQVVVHLEVFKEAFLC